MEPHESFPGKMNLIILVSAGHYAVNYQGLKDKIITD